MIAQVKRNVRDKQEAELILATWRRWSNFMVGYVLGSTLIAVFSCSAQTIARAKGR